MDLFYAIILKCINDEILYNQVLEKNRVFDFLQVNKELDEVRGKILGTKPLPSLREAFSEVRLEESRKTVMLSVTSYTGPKELSQGSAFNTTYSNSSYIQG